MPTYPIFTVEGGQRVAINPEQVIHVVDLGNNRVTIQLPHGAGTFTVKMTLDAVVARLTGQRDLSA